MIDAEAGAAIIQAVKAGGSVTADFTIPEDANWAVGFRDAPPGGIPSSYSSWGGTNDLGIKPDVAAPGSRIYSTFLGGTFKTFSGTSMATPYVAGVAALFISAHGGRAVHGPEFARDLARRIITSGESLPWQVMEVTALPTDFGFLSPVPQSGSGLINATKVLQQSTSLTFAPFALNDTANFRPSHVVEIKNDGNGSVSYTFSLQPAGGFNLQGRTSGFLADILDIGPFSLAPEVTLPGTIVVEPRAVMKTM
jgi:subtilisin family serine protease